MRFYKRTKWAIDKLSMKRASGRLWKTGVIFVNLRRSETTQVPGASYQSAWANDTPLQLPPGIIIFTDLFSPIDNIPVWMVWRQIADLRALGKRLRHYLSRILKSWSSYKTDTEINPIATKNDSKLVGFIYQEHCLWTILIKWQINGKR